MKTLTLVKTFNAELRQALQDGSYGAEVVDTVLNEVTEDYFRENVRRSLVFDELFQLACEYAVHDEAVLCHQPRPIGHDLVPFRGAGESAGSALADAVQGFGPFAIRDLKALRNSLTAACLERAGAGAEQRARMLAWLTGFHNTAEPNQVSPIPAR